MPRNRGGDSGVEVLAWRAEGHRPCCRFECSPGKSAASNVRCSDRARPTERAATLWPPRRISLAEVRAIHRPRPRNSFPWRSHSASQVWHPTASGRDRANSSSRHQAESPKTWGYLDGRRHAWPGEGGRSASPVHEAPRRSHGLPRKAKPWEGARLRIGPPAKFGALARRRFQK